MNAVWTSSRLPTTYGVPLAVETAGEVAAWEAWVLEAEAVPDEPVVVLLLLLLHAVRSDAPTAIIAVIHMDRRWRRPIVAVLVAVRPIALRPEDLDLWLI